MLWGLQPVEQQPAYGLTVQVLRRHVHMGLLLPGERLPPERTLAEQLSVSRVTLREALRVLETEGYFVVRRGASGGTFVSELDVLGDIAAHRISRDPALILRVMEFREALEPTAARHAAVRRTPTDLAALERACAQLADAMDVAQIRRAECMLYTAVGAASHNPLLARGIDDAKVALFIFHAQPAAQEHARAARQLCTAIAERNADQSEKAMRELLLLDRAQLRGVVGF